MNRLELGSIRLFYILVRVTYILRNNITLTECFVLQTIILVLQLSAKEKPAAQFVLGAIEKL